MTTTPLPPPAIEVTGLVKSFGDHEVLRGLDLTVAPGTVHALLGSNGAGKTTAIRILSTLLRADGGRAAVDGHDVAAEAARVREAISLTGQFTAVDDILTGHENLVLVGQLRHVVDPHTTADTMLARFGLTEAGERRAATYSGGMRRRLDIAMSLVGDPSVLFLDEPTTGLDPEARLEVWRTVRELAAQGTTILLTTQHPRGGRAARGPDLDPARRPHHRRRNPRRAQGNAPPGHRRVRRGRIVVVGAHPDDETLGAGGLVHAAAAAGRRVEVVTATAGEASHPHSPTHPPERLAAVRRDELRRATALLAPDARVTCLALPDGDVAAHEDELVAALVATIGTDGSDVLICAPWRGDGHPDHEAAGRAAATAAHRTDAELWEYPVWLWHWGQPDDLPMERVGRLPLDRGSVEAKRAAIDAHASQVRPLSEAPGDEVLLGPDLLAHVDRDPEVFLIDGPDVDDDALDRVHEDRDDPWDVESLYERRKRAVTLASLPREHYRSALEVGCSVGALAVDLATRCDRLLAIDSSPTAVDLARRRTAGIAGLEVRRARVPDEWPEGRHDLVSVSEVGYFLSPRGLEELVRLSLGSLTDDGHLLLCHWRHQPVGWPLAGPAVHDAFVATGAPVLVEHHEPDFLLHVLGRPS